YHALILKLFPFSEIVLHLSFLPFVAMLAWSILSLAKRFGCPPLFLLIFWLLGPGYLPGQNAMLDVPVMALSMTATAIFIRGVDQTRLGLTSLAGILLGAALLTKYSSLVYGPVWAAYLIGHRKGRHWFGLVLAAMVFCSWCAWSASRYGVVHARILID